jgi:hypothetical protein
LVFRWFCAVKFKDSSSSSPTFSVTGKHKSHFLHFVLCSHFAGLFLTPVMCWWFTVVDQSPEYVVCFLSAHGGGFKPF